MAALIGTENFRESHVVLWEAGKEVGFARDALTANEAAITVYKVGTVLGKATASGKVKVSKADAVDGSEVPFAICLQDVTIAATTDTKVRVLAHHAVVSKGGLILDATFNTAPELAAAYAALEAKFIKVNDTI